MSSPKKGYQKKLTEFVKKLVMKNKAEKDDDRLLSAVLCLLSIGSLLSWFLYDLSTVDIVLSSFGIGFFSIAIFAICFHSFCFMQPAILYSSGLGFYALVQMVLKMVAVHQCSSSVWPHGHLPWNATEVQMQLGVECLHSQVVLGWILLSFIGWLFTGAILCATSTDFCQTDEVVEKQKSAGDAEKARTGKSGQGKKGSGKGDPDKKTPKDTNTC